MTQLAVRQVFDRVPVFRIELGDLLPEGWAAEVAQVADTSTRWSVLRGESVTSREVEFSEAAEARVGVVTGDLIAERLAWLDKVYRETLLEAANTLGLGHFEPSSDLRTGVNINSTPQGARYEWHVDSNPLTGLLFATSHSNEDGGQLVFRPDPQKPRSEAWEFVVTPKAGTCLLFDAREAAHVVTCLERGRRLSVPMNYYFVGQQERPADLDGYLYG